MLYDVALYDFVELNPTKPFCYRCEAQVQKETELRQTVCINSYPNYFFDSYFITSTYCLSYLNNGILSFAFCFWNETDWKPREGIGDGQKEERSTCLIFRDKEEAKDNETTYRNGLIKSLNYILNRSLQLDQRRRDPPADTSEFV